MKITEKMLTITEAKKVKETLSKKGYNAYIRDYINDANEYGYTVGVKISYDGMYKPKSWYDTYYALCKACKNLVVNSDGCNEVVYIFNGYCVTY